MQHRYFYINKPYDMVSQFVSPDKVRLLKDLDFNFPEGTHAIGRLDNNSEGLLLLTTNKKVTRLLFESKVPHKRTYLVMVQRKVQPATLELLRNGIPIMVQDGAMYTTAPCEAYITEPPAYLPKSGYALNERIPYTWLSITLTEGKYHQVRKMVKNAGHSCMRLIRTSIENLHLGDLPPGQVKELSEADFFNLLKLENVPANLSI